MTVNEAIEIAFKRRGQSAQYIGGPTRFDWGSRTIRSGFEERFMELFLIINESVDDKSVDGELTEILSYVMLPANN